MNLGMATDTLEFKKSTSEIKEAIQSIGGKTIRCQVFVMSFKRRKQVLSYAFTVIR
ncbi:hypothetical protein CIRMBP1314_01726 [Enterococcus cecorum]|nr:hypothetical protein CIRMBP1314_01726 [Enterococcus cecorum]